jgi:hypothetical protein
MSIHESHDTPVAAPTTRPSRPLTSWYLGRPARRYVERMARHRQGLVT